MMLHLVRRVLVVLAANRTAGKRVPTNRKYGETALRLGLLRADRLEQVLAKQRELLAQGKNVSVRLIIEKAKLLTGEQLKRIDKLLGIRVETTARATPTSGRAAPPGGAPTRRAAPAISLRPLDSSPKLPSLAIEFEGVKGEAEEVLDARGSASASGRTAKPSPAQTPTRRPAGKIERPSRSEALRRIAAMPDVEAKVDNARRPVAKAPPPSSRATPPIAARPQAPTSSSAPRRPTSKVERPSRSEALRRIAAMPEVEAKVDSARLPIVKSSGTSTAKPPLASSRPALAQLLPDPLQLAKPAKTAAPPVKRASSALPLSSSPSQHAPIDPRAAVKADPPIHGEKTPAMASKKTLPKPSRSEVLRRLGAIAEQGEKAGNETNAGADDVSIDPLAEDADVFDSMHSDETEDFIDASAPPPVLEGIEETPGLRAESDDTLESPDVEDFSQTPLELREAFEMEAPEEALSIADVDSESALAPVTTSDREDPRFSGEDEKNKVLAHSDTPFAGDSESENDFTPLEPENRLVKIATTSDLAELTESHEMEDLPHDSARGLEVEVFRSPPSDEDAFPTVASDFVAKRTPPDDEAEAVATIRSSFRDEVLDDDFSADDALSPGADRGNDLDASLEEGAKDTVRDSFIGADALDDPSDALNEEPEPVSPSRKVLKIRIPTPFREEVESTGFDDESAESDDDIPIASPSDAALQAMLHGARPETSGVPTPKTQGSDGAETDDIGADVSDELSDNPDMVSAKPENDPGDDTTLDEPPVSADRPDGETHQAKHSLHSLLPERPEVEVGKSGKRRRSNIYVDGIAVSKRQRKAKEKSARDTATFGAPARAETTPTRRGGRRRVWALLAGLLALLLALLSGLAWLPDLQPFRGLLENDGALSKPLRGWNEFAARHLAGKPAAGTSGGESPPLSSAEKGGGAP